MLVYGVVYPGGDVDIGGRVQYPMNDMNVAYITL